MKKSLYLLFFTLIVGHLTINAQLLEVNFSDSKTIEDYVSSDPNGSQLSAINKSSKDKGKMTIESDMLKFTRETTDAVSLSFSRVKAFAGPPKVVICEFDIKVSGNTSKKTTAAMFQIGSGFTTANSSNGKVHSRFSINFSDTPGEFSIKDSKQGGVTGAVLSGKKRLKFIVNNMDGIYTYEVNKKSYQVETARWDLFVDDELYLSGKDATDVTASLENIKLFFDDGIGSISIGNILITSPSSLPVKLEHFDVLAKNNVVELSWKTALESGISAFEIHKSLNGIEFEKITSVKSEGKNAYYSYRDKYPANGTSYYKLFQVDENGNLEELSVKFLNVNRNKDFTVYAASDAFIVYYEAPKEGTATLVLRNIKGQKILEQQVGFNEGFNKFYLDAMLKEGVYLVNADFDGDKYVKKLVLK